MPRATTMRHLIVLALEGMVVLAGVLAQATEGGANAYLQGTYQVHLDGQRIRAFDRFTLAHVWEKHVCCAQ